MMPKIEDYRKLAGDELIEEIKTLAKPLAGMHIAHVNSSFIGGGVAELLRILILLFNDLGIPTDWRLLKGEPGFYRVTKTIHNLLQGGEGNLNGNEWKLYLETVEMNRVMNHFSNHALVVVHDPQPLPLIQFYPERTHRWMWRCHIDLSSPEQKTWGRLLEWINNYETVLVSHPDYKNKSILPPQIVLMPSIDPFSNKNRELSKEEHDTCLTKIGLVLKKPYILQVSRFDRFKDPRGVIDIYRSAKRNHDIALVLAGEIAMDDPEGAEIFDALKEESAEDSDIHLILGASDLTINALQRGAAAVLQNSHREGFGLTVTEAMWKNKPVITRAVGGIRLQIEDGKNGFFIESNEQAAALISKLLDDEALREKIGQAAHETVKEKFLTTRHLKEYLTLMQTRLGLDKGVKAKP